MTRASVRLLAAIGCCVVLAGCGIAGRPTTVISEPMPAPGLSAGVTTEPPDPGPGPAPAPADPGKTVVALGHSGATGYDSDPGDPSTDVLANSWATGTNPEVDSIYLRLVERDPAFAGHNVNLARSGSTVDDLQRQAALLADISPEPTVVFIQTVDNDIRCDGTDGDYLPEFDERLAAAIDIILSVAPDAHVYLLSTWSTVQQFADVVAGDPQFLAANSGDGPCDLFDPDGVMQESAIEYEQAVKDSYHEQLALVCARYPSCSYDGGAMQTMPLSLDDLTADGGHLDVAGQRTYADLVWRTFFGS